MNKENTMNEAQKIAQALAAIPADFQDKAVAATMRSQFWEIIDCPVTLDLALKTQDPKACQYLLEIYESDNPEEQLEAFKVFRNRLVLKVAKEFMEVNKIGDVRQYRLKRQTRVTLSNIFGKKVA